MLVSLAIECVACACFEIQIPLSYQHLRGCMYRLAMPLQPYVRITMRPPAIVMSFYCLECGYMLASTVNCGNRTSGTLFCFTGHVKLIAGATALSHSVEQDGCGGGHRGPSLSRSQRVGGWNHTAVKLGTIGVGGRLENGHRRKGPYLDNHLAPRPLGCKVIVRNRLSYAMPLF